MYKYKIKKITFKMVLMKFLAMYLTNHKLSFDIYSMEFTNYLHGTRSLLNVLMTFGIKENQSF